MSGPIPKWPRTLSRLESNTPENGTRPIHLLTELSRRDGSTQLVVSLTDGSDVWEGSIDEGAMMDYAAKQDMDTLEDYLFLSRQALTGKTNQTENCPEDPSLEFDLKSEDGNPSKASFIWKKPLPSGIKVHLGAVPLTRLEGGVTHFLDELLSELLERDERTDRAVGEKLECEKQREEAVAMLKQTAEGKEEHEQEMIRSFCLALNKKKEKIRCLKEELGLINRIRSGVELRGSGSDTDGEGSGGNVDSLQEAANSATEGEKKGGLLKARMGADMDEEDLMGPPLKKRTRVTKGKPKPTPKQSPRIVTQKGRVASRKGKTSLDADDLIKYM